MEGMTRGVQRLGLSVTSLLRTHLLLEGKNDPGGGGGGARF